MGRSELGRIDMEVNITKLVVRIARVNELSRDSYGEKIVDWKW